MERGRRVKLILNFGVSMAPSFELIVLRLTLLKKAKRLKKMLKNMRLDVLVAVT